MKVRMKFVATVAMLVSTFAGGALAQDRRDVRVADDVGRAVRQYAQYTIFDDVSGRVDAGIVTLDGVNKWYEKFHVLKDVSFEVKRGEWKQFENGPYKIQAMGSVAYKLALVSVGLADITFTLTPKHEWDVVAGAALVQSGGGFVSTLEKMQLKANRKEPLLSGLLASGPFLKEQLFALVRPHTRVAEKGSLVP